MPHAGHPVFIPAGVTVTVDESTPALGDLIVVGNLVVADRDLTITADSIMVMGRFTAGTATAPLTADVTIVLTGTEEDPQHGARAFVAMAPGVIEMHGADQDKRSWTQLEGTVSKGATTIQVAETTGWEVGDEIVIAPSGLAPFEDDNVTIAAISGNTITVTPALRYDHYGEIDRIHGTDVDMRAEVGLLSRNITVTSADDAEANLKGGHMMIMDGAEAYVSGVELHRLGQTGIAGRYPFHWHLANDVSGQYIRNSSIHDTFQRAVVVHGTSRALVESVVAYNTFSHAFVWSEHGNEWNNRFVDNLAVRVNDAPGERRFLSFERFNRDGELSLGPSSQAEDRGSGFWGRNPQNELIGNHVAGVEKGNGFFFDTRHLSHSQKQIVKEQRASQIHQDNVTHSIGGIRKSLYNYSPLATGHGVFVSTYPDDPAIDIVGLTAYKNVSAVWAEDDNTSVVGLRSVDNSTGVFAHRATIRDGFIAARSGNDIGGFAPLLSDQDDGGGIHYTGQGRDKIVRVYDTTFVGVSQAAIVVRTVDVEEPSEVSGLTLIDTDGLFARGTDKKPAGGTIVDLDGSMCGSAGQSVRLPSRSELRC